MHTDYDNEQALYLLNYVLNDIVKERGSDPARTGIRAHPSGVYCLEVDDVPEEWFFDEMHLMRWLVKQNNERLADST